MNDNKYDPLAGDIYVMWGAGLLSRIIRYLEKAIFGIPKAPTHNQVVINAEICLSAGASGVRYVSTDVTRYKGDVVVMRPKIYDGTAYRPLTDDEKQKVKDVAGLYFGRGYDYFNYFIWLGRVSIIPIALALGFVWPLVGWWGRGGLVALILFLSISNPVHKWLKREQTSHWHCSELTGTMMEHIGISFGMDNNNYLAPLHIWQASRLCPEKWDIFYLKSGKYISED